MLYYLKTIFRNLKRFPGYSIINIAGLTIGITVAILIFLWVYNERSYDDYHPDAKRIYRITSTLGLGKDDLWIWETSPNPLAPIIKKDIPEIELITGMSGQPIEEIKVNNEGFYVSGNAAYVDKYWFEMFDYKLIEGSFETYGRHPFSIVLTKSEAVKYFGRYPAVGKTMKINNTDYTIQAVVTDNPSNSSFQFNIMASLDGLIADPRQKANAEKWGYFDRILFVKLRNDADTMQVCSKINSVIANNQKNGDTHASLRSLKDIHFESDIMSPWFQHGSKKMVSIFTLLGLLLIFTACINYVNLTTAKANTRSKEVGIRKIIGADRKVLFMQFIAESFIVCLVSVVISLLLIRVLSSPYRSLVDNIDLSFSSPAIWLIVGVVLLSTTLANGIYPALILSSFKPVNALKGISILRMKNSYLRKGLVIFQFALSATLIISVITIYKQMQFVRNMDPGYQREQVVTVIPSINTLFSSGEENAERTLENIKNRLSAFPFIKAVALCDDEITKITAKRGIEGNADWDGRPADIAGSLKVMSADGDYKNTLGLELAEGRWFENGNIADKNNFILNETAIRELKIRKPYIGQRFDLSGTKGRIIGIVKDFHFESLHEKIGILVIENSFNRLVTFKIQEGKSIQAMQEVKEIWKEFFPNDPFEYSFLDESFNNLYKADIKTSRLMLVFSILTIVIALLGLLGLSTFTIERRTKEIGIRKVLGASMLSILQSISKEFLILIAVALIIAIPVSWWAMSKWLDDFAYRINISVWFFVAGSCITVIMALIAISSQAIKAATANPVNAIKTE